MKRYDISTPRSGERFRDRRWYSFLRGFIRGEEKRNGQGERSRFTLLLRGTATGR